MPTEILMPRFGWTMEEGVLAEWIKKDGDPVKAGDVLFTVESDKALNEVESFETGLLHVPPDSPPPGSTVKVGALLAYIVQPGEALPMAQTSAAVGVPTPVVAVPSPTASPSKKRGSAISPRARRLAEKLGINVESLQGSGRTGRILERDVQAATAKQRPAMPTLRRVIADRMTTSAHTTAPVTLTTEVDATELVHLREQLKHDPIASAQPIPTYADLLAKLTAHALLEHPALNARLEGEAIVSSSEVHIGLAVDTERGLLVPVVRDVQTKSLKQIAYESAALVARAKAGQANATELRGSTFTLTNLGMYDIDAFTPIINLPECAILGVGRIVPKQVVVDVAAEKVAIRQMMVLSLTFDHRLVDGAPAARFLQRIKQLIEQPYVWLVT